MKSKILLFLLCYSLFSSAQDSAFQIKDYKYRTPGFRALWLNAGLSGSFSNYKNDNYLDQSSSNVSLGPATVSYSRIISTERRLHESGLFASPGMNFTSRKNDGKTSKASIATTLAQWHRNDRFYRKGNWFTEIGNDFSALYNYQKQTDTTFSYKNNGLKLENTVVVGIGKGRIERVQDAQTAFYILADLQRQGLLASEVTKEKAYQLAQVITAVNNRRVFDFRRRRIYELTQLDSFLRSSGLIQNPDIRHFTTLNDNWSLAFNPYRLSGSNWYARLRPGIGYNYNRQDDPKAAGAGTRSSGFFYTVSPQVGYENYKPLSLKWQRNLGVNAAYRGRGNNDQTKFISPAGTTVYDYNYYNWSIAFNGFYGIGYFPNNRTLLNATFNLEATFFDDRSVSVSPSLRFEMQYFLGYQTYFSANAFVGYASDTNRPIAPDVRQFQSSFSVQLSHVLF